MSLKYEPVSVEIESCTDLVQLSIPEIESCTDVCSALQRARLVPTHFWSQFPSNPSVWPGAVRRGAPWTAGNWDLIAASVDSKYSVGPSSRRICTTSVFAMTENAMQNDCGPRALVLHRVFETHRSSRRSANPRAHSYRTFEFWSYKSGLRFLMRPPPRKALKFSVFENTLREFSVSAKHGPIHLRFQKRIGISEIDTSTTFRESCPVRAAVS